MTKNCLSVISLSCPLLSVESGGGGGGGERRFHCFVGKAVISHIFVLFSVMRHGWTVLWENESYFCPLSCNASRLAGITWFVR